MSFFQPKPEGAPVAEQSQAKARERWARNKREAAAKVAEVGEIAPCANPERREACRLDLHRFLVDYFPETTGLTPFSKDHIRVIARIQRCILHGGRMINAVYRGFAKTTITENAALWAVLFGHRRCVAIFAADEDLAKTSLESIKLELEENDALFEDFGEVCAPIRALEGKHQRCDSQTHDGERTHIKWTADRVVLPKVAGSLASGTMLVSKGITGGSRGLKRKTAKGENVRPDFIFLDDIQTDESASTAGGVKKRLGILKKSILKLGSHRKAPAVVMNGTCIQPDDVVDQLLDLKKNPSWQGERIKLVEKWADAHETLWKEYAELRNSYDPDVEGDQARAHAEANAFYAEHRAEMDAGCLVNWESCFDPELEASAVQHAYNVLIDDGPESFASEMQQQPVREKLSDIEEMTADAICAKVNRMPEGVVPVECSLVVGFIDVQAEALFWAVAGFGAGFTGSVLSYGMYPDQKRHDFTYRELRHKLSDSFPGVATEAVIYAALMQLIDTLAGREWSKFGGGTLRMRRLLVDEGFETAVVHKVCRESPHAAILMPAKGYGIPATRPPMRSWGVKPGETPGHHWKVTRPAARATPHVVIDTNAWKTILHARLRSPMAAPGCLSLYGDNPDRHRLLAAHLLAEYRVRATAQGRTVDEWFEFPDKRDNHWLDCATGCCVAASMEGIGLTEWEPARPQRKHFTVPESRKHVPGGGPRW